MVSDPALCKRLAEGVMGWTLDQSGCYWHKAGNATQVPVNFDKHAWHPDIDIAQAMMVAERIGGLALDDNRKDRDKGWSATFYGELKMPDCVAETPAMAISKAADAWLKQGGKDA